MIRKCEDYRTLDGSELIPDDEDVDRLAKMLQAASDPVRLRILFLLGKRELCVCEIASGVGKKQPIVSHHLSVLKNACLIKSRKDGKWTHYRVDNPLIGEIFKNGKSKKKG